MIEAYLDALDRKAGAFAELLEISRGQDALLDREEPGELLSLLGRKQALLQRIEGIDREIASLRTISDGPDGPDGPAGEDARAAACIQRIREALEALVACEEETRKLVEERKRGTLEQISRLRMGRRAAELYRREPPGGRALDREE